MATVVVLDTSALMLPVELDVRVFDELERLLGSVEPVVPSAVLDELARLGDAGGTAGRAATVGATLAGERCRTVPTDGGTADDAVLAVAADRAGAYLVTADRDLRDRALSLGIPVVAPREAQRLAVHRP